MELKELKCKNCGAKIELEEGKTEENIINNFYN